LIEGALPCGVEPKAPGIRSCAPEKAGRKIVLITVKEMSRRFSAEHNIDEPARRRAQRAEAMLICGPDQHTVARGQHHAAPIN
jgi:hypothetical protein